MPRRRRTLVEMFDIEPYWFFNQSIKLYKALSLLYRRQILQENIRWKALDEIYKICMLLHRSDLSYFRKFSSNVFRIFRQNFTKIRYFEFFSSIFAQILMKFYRNFADILGKFLMLKISEIFEFSTK